MNRRLLTTLAIAFVIAAICGFVVYRMVGTHIAATRTEQTTRVVAAAADIKLGTILAPANLTTIQITGPLPQGAITDPKQAIGRGALTDIYQGEPLIQARLAAPGSGGGLAPTIPQGMRAIAVRVDQVVGVAGFVTPGMRVDVIVIGTPPNANGSDQLSKTILQNIQVLSAGTDIQRDAEGKPQQVQVVNILVTPEQAEVISLATGGSNRIQLVLRNPLDTKTSQVPITAMSNLFTGAPEKPVKVAGTARPRLPRRTGPEPYSVVIFNGTSRSEQRVNPPGE
ncbi:MAG TPA: Flp pilus assembly protein CpaB [Terracidiphilus sp.]|nr:Flp pilus assembly protein CpaB [Terracidiphilus sp.]